MSGNIDVKKQTGRTNNMIRAAIQSYERGEKPFIAVCTVHDMMRIRALVPHKDIEVGLVHINDINPKDLHLSCDKLLGKGYTFFFDHSLLEHYYTGVLAEWERYDESTIYDEILFERSIQRRKWDQYEDDQKPIWDWVDIILDYAHWARRMAAMRSWDKARRRLIQIATLAIAAIESLDRKHGPSNPS